MSASTGITYALAVPQPQLPGDIVGVLLQNTQTTAQQAGPITFGETFAAGAVQPGSTLWATIDGQKTAVQMDVKTTNPDGSVCMAVLTTQSPALAAGAQAGLMLSVGPPATPPPPISIAQLTQPGAWNFAVNLALQNASGPPTNFTVNGATLLSQALAAGTATTILSGPQVTQVQVNEAITSSLRVTLNISLYADGTTSTDVQFNNDAAMTASGGALTYNATITQNGQTAFSQSDITEYQYQTWDTTVGSPSAPNLNIVHDTGYLEQTGAILNYDQTTGVYSSLIAANTAAMQSGVGFGILGSAGITTYMPQTGGRPDIGATTEENTMWLMTGDPNAAAYALTQADHAGSIPWHFYNSTTQNYTNTDDYPTLWTDPRGGSSGTIGLTQQPQDYNSATDPGNGWAIDTDHAPDLDYDAYLLTGNQYYLDQLNAEANESILYLWPATRGIDIVVTAGQQVRGQAWDLRAIGEAAYANPNGSAEKSYFTQVLSDNLSALVAELPTLTAEQGTSYGWIPGVDGSNNTLMAPWQQDYFASTIVALAERGNAQAVQILQWEQNFLVGRFLSSAQGFDPNDGAAYNLVIGTDTTWFTSWAQVEAATVAYGASNGSGWLQSEGDYAQLALQSLAGSITVLETPDAIKAYGWLIAYGPQDFIGGTANANAPDFNVVPRLSDGQLLTGNNVYVLDDAAAAVIQGGNVDQLISETGSANVVLRGGADMNLLFAGSGSDWLIGGAGNDYLFGGAGAVTLVGGAGSNYLDAGAGAATFVFTTTDNATDVVADFQIGADLLDVLDPTGAVLTPAAIAALIAGATTDSNGDAVLHLSATHSVTLMGIAPSQLTTALFAATAPGAAPGGPITQTSSLTSWGTPSPGGGSSGGGGTGGSLTITGASGTMNLSQSYYDITGDSQALIINDTAGRVTVTGGAGGLTFSTTVGADLITTAADSINTITLALGSEVYSNGTDLINGGTGNSTFIVTGAALINGSTGNSTYQLAGDDVVSSLGVDTVSASAGASVALTVADLGIVSEQGATLAIRSGLLRVATLTGGMGNLTVFAGSQVLQATIGGGLGATRLNLGHFATSVQSSGSDTIIGGGGATTINASGYVHLKEAGGAISLNASSGMASVVGGNGAFTFSGNAGLNFTGAAGAASFTLGTGVSVITAGSGNVSLVGGTGPLDFTSGVGQANLTIGAGSAVDLQGSGTVNINGAAWGAGTIYDIFASTGNAVDTIDNYRPGTDQLLFSGCGIASQNQVGGSLNLSLTDGTTVILPGVSHL